MSCEHKHQAERHKRIKIKGEGYTVTLLMCRDCGIQLDKKVTASV